MNIDRTGSPDISWHVETSNDAAKWRRMGTAWTFPNEPILVHGAGQYLRFKPTDAEGWSEPLERTGNECMALIDLDAATRRDLLPGDEHLELPVFLPGGEAGRLLSFEASEDGYSWTYRLEFTGEVPEKYR